jgi:hypothetical protein
MTRVDKDPPQPDSPYANTSETSPGDQHILETPTGRVAANPEGETTVAEDEIAEKSVGSRPVSDRTDFRLSGTGANETEDGLDELEESLRHTAEDIRDGAQPDDEPIFDKAERS